MLKDLFKNAFNKTNDSIILVVPLIIFATIAEAYSYYVLNHANTTAKILVAFISMYIMIAGFSASWFYMAKKTLKLSEKVFVYDKDRMKAIYRLFLSLPEGLGKLFLNFLGAFAIYFCLILIPYWIFSTVTYSYYYLTTGNIAGGILVNVIFLLLILAVLNYFFLFLIPELVYAKSTPVQAITNSFRGILKLFPKSLYLYLAIVLLYALETVLYYVLISLSPYLLFVALLLKYYLIIYLVVLMFLYYGKEFPKDEQQS